MHNLIVRLWDGLVPRKDGVAIIEVEVRIIEPVSKSETNDIVCRATYRCWDSSHREKAVYMLEPRGTKATLAVDRAVRGSMDRDRQCRSFFIPLSSPRASSASTLR